MLAKHLNLMLQEKKIPKSILDDLPADYETELTSQFAKSIDGTQIEDLMTALEMAIQLEQVSPGVSRSTIKWNQAFRRNLLSLEIDVDDLHTIAESDELMKKELDRASAMQDSQIANQAADGLSKLTG